MATTILSPDSAVRMPWKNGRGSTLELASDAAPGRQWTWRLSIADVPESGPFSRFEGCDRHILCLEGMGMRLHVDGVERCVPHEGSGLHFSGDADTSATLDDGACRDANLMLRRDTWRGGLVLMRGRFDRFLNATRTVLHLVAGDLVVNGHTLAPRATAIIEGVPARVGGDGVVLMATMDRV